MIGKTQRNFSRGELGPSLHARVDTVQFAAGLATARNMRVLRMGGIQSRPGSYFVGEVKDSSKRVRLIPFVFNASQTYVLEFGNLYMRVHQAGIQLTLTAQNITAVTNALPPVVTYSGSDTYANDDEVYISGVVGPMAPFINNRNFLVKNRNTGANTFEIVHLDGASFPDSTSWGLYTSGGTVEEVYTITTPYVEADLAALNFTQSGDVVTITHPSYKPRDLTRTGHTAWTLTAITFAPQVPAPTTAAASGSGTGFNFAYVVTAMEQSRNDESLVSNTASFTDDANAASATPHIITWDTVSGADIYKIYKLVSGAAGFLAFARTNSYTYYGDSAPNFNVAPPEARNPFDPPGAGAYADASGYNPAAVCYHQQRKCFGNTAADPETIFMSRTGRYTNFTISIPTQSDQAVTFTLDGGQVNEIRHLISNEGFVALTGGGEWLIQGDDSGIISPTAINADKKEEFGASTVTPVVLNKRIIYVDASGSIVREIPPAFESPIVDRTLFSAHLFDKYTLTALTSAKSPTPIAMAIRSDGKALSLTHVPDQEIFGWSPLDTDGTYEDACGVPEGSEWFIYVVVNRTIDGDTKRYIERMETRTIDDIKDFIAADSALTYDGRNTSVYPIGLFLGLSATDWTASDTLTLGAAPGFLTDDDIGSEIHFYDGNATETPEANAVLLGRFTILSWDNVTGLGTGRFDRTVPAELRGGAGGGVTSQWAKARKTLTGLWHLEGEDVSVFADGSVAASPNNAGYDVVTVTNGSITLEECAAVIHVGLPFTCDLETLDIDQSSPTLASKKKNVRAVTLHLEETRGVWVGPKAPTDDDDDPLEGLVELKIRNLEGYDSPVDLLTGKVSVNIKPEWNSNGRIFIRQVDPIPMTVLAITPDGDIEGGK